MTIEREANVSAATAAVISGAISATTMATSQMLLANPTVRYVAAIVGDQVVVAQGNKADALDRAEACVGAVAHRRSARTFDTRGEAEAYAQEKWGAIPRHLGLVSNPVDIRAIKRRLLR